MSAKLIEIARTRRRLAVEKKRLKDDMRSLRLRRTSYRPMPVQEKLQGKATV